jgi:tRNA G18 (ribose-2'-O)-methylase SpoU
MVEDPADPRIAGYHLACDGERRRREGLFLAEGRLLVRRLLETPRFPVQSLLLTPAALDDLRDALGSGPAVHVASSATIRAVVGFKFHRGAWPSACAASRCPPTRSRPRAARARSWRWKG